MAAASYLGIKTAEVSLLYPRRPLLVVKRYDRTSSNEQSVEGLLLLDRLHQEDACQALGLDSSAKYEREKTAYLPQVVELIMTYAGNPIEVLHALHRPMLFNYAIGNCDAHLKNYSFIWENATSVRLAPAYDLVSTSVYDGRFGAKLSRSMGLRMGSHLNIDNVDAEDVALLAKTLRQAPKAAQEERQRVCDGLQDALIAAAEGAASFGFKEHSEELAERILSGAKKRMRALQ